MVVAKCQRCGEMVFTPRTNTSYLLHGPAEVVARRFERIRQENDARNRNMLTAIARTKSKP